MFFQNSVIKKYLAALNSEQLTAAWEQYKAYFLNKEIQDNIRSSKEEQFQEGFLRELFVKVFGYTLNPSPNFNLITEQKNETDAKKADGAILRDDKVIGVIELKDHKTTDLSHVERQAFGYKNQHKDTKYVIISNFEKLRFYIDNAVEHIEWNLFTLTEDDFRLLYFCLAWPTLSTDLPLKAKLESVSNEDRITQQLYKDYSAFKREIFADILANNTTIETPKEQTLLLFRKTQKLLDRLLFIFFAEDCGLLPPNLMIQILEQWVLLKENDAYEPLYTRIKKYFGYLNAGNDKRNIFAYNGGLFKPDEELDSLTISDEVLARFTRKLSEYDYASEVDVNILGHIFENSLNEIEEVTAQINAGEAPTVSKRKRDGVFYTPQYITKYIVENTVGRLCAEKKAEMGIDEAEYFADKNRQMATKKRLLDQLTKYRDWLLGITICDPACGSGAFLNAALQFLMAEHKLLDEMEAKITGSTIAFQAVENSILENNLYGVDINEESVEIARLALWLRTAKPHRKLNSLNNNIKCGNSLISDPEIAGDKAFNWKAEFPQVFAKGGFDIVIGNPPYVQLQSMGDMSDVYAKCGYEVYNKSADLYCLFYEQGCKLLKDKGLLGFIASNKWLKANYGENLRRYFIANTNPILLVDFPGVRIFPDATVDPQILVLRKEPYKGQTQCCLYDSDMVDVANYVAANSATFHFTEEPWRAMPKEHKNIIEKLNCFTPIKNLPFEINYG
ncbi:MAG: N-6 DNA methylase, partial [Paludibacteraceae bacterium]|nr:N-6 DNA methylase [Paludibacteraceae bacterium]